MTKQAKRQISELSKEIIELQQDLEDYTFFLKTFDDSDGSIKEKIENINKKLRPLRDLYFKIYPNPTWT